MFPHCFLTVYVFKKECFATLTFHYLKFISASMKQVHILNIKKSRLTVSKPSRLVPVNKKELEVDLDREKLQFL